MMHTRFVSLRPISCVWLKTSEPITAVLFYEKHLLKFELLLEPYIAITPAGSTSFRESAPLWMKERLHIERAIRKGLGDALFQLSLAYAFSKNAAMARASAVEVYRLNPGYPGILGWMRTLGVSP